MPGSSATGVPPSASEPVQVRKIDQLMEQASAALVARKYFDCERLCVDALRRAYAALDYDRMARIVLPLQEARRQKRDLAIDAGWVQIVNGPAPTGKQLVAGCYLVSPPRVGVDGRLLREAADAKKVPVIVLVREPETKEGLWPLVAVGPRTVRTKVAPPRAPVPKVKKAGKKAAKKGSEDVPAVPKPPPVRWFVESGEELGDAAIASIPEHLLAPARVDHLMDLLAAHPDHEKLHQRLEEAAREAARVPVRRRRPRADDPFDQDEDQ